MKTILMTMAAVSALAVAAPAAAQPWHGDGNSSGVNSAELQMRIQDGVRNGAISRREVTPLRNSLRQLNQLERQYARNGFTNRERNTLRQRSATLSRQIANAERSGYSRWTPDERFHRANRGDRFAGDVRIGQRSSVRMVALPAQYRNDYRDDERVYYRYDQDRIYQVNRLTNMIMGMIDLPN